MLISSPEDNPQIYHPSPWPWIVWTFAALAVGFELLDALNEPDFSVFAESERTVRSAAFDIAIASARPRRAHTEGFDRAIGPALAQISDSKLQPSNVCE
jgi:hypothetical protein